MTQQQGGMTLGGCLLISLFLVGGTFALIYGGKTRENPFKPDELTWPDRQAIMQLCSDSMHIPALSAQDMGGSRGQVLMKDRRTCFTFERTIQRIEK